MYLRRGGLYIFILVCAGILLLYSHIFRSGDSDSKLWSPKGQTKLIKEWTFNRTFLTTTLKSRAAELERTKLTELIRKLSLFSIRHVNLRLKDTACAKWWVNPLSISRLTWEKLTSDLLEYTVTFEVQPGRIEFQTVVCVRKIERTVHDPYAIDAYEFISGRRLDPTDKCSSVEHELQEICLCSEEQSEAEEKTRKIRELWNATDPELEKWPPSAKLGKTID